MKKLLSCLLCLCMVMALFPIMAAAADVNVQEGNKFSYAYDVQRYPAFPSYESAEMELTNLNNPLKDGGSWYSSSKGEWTLAKVGTFGESDSFYPAASEYLKGVVDSVARNYNLTGEGLNGTVIHQLTDAEGKHVAYGVVLGYDEAEGYVLFIGDEWSMSGAGYFLSVNEVTEDPVTFMADAIAPSLDKKGFEIDGTMYETFAEAMEAANDGDAIVMHEDMTASDIITIDKNISLIGNDHTIYTSATRGINIDTDGDVLIKNVTIEHSDAPATVSQNYRTINIINQPANVTIDGVTINSGNNYCVYVPLSGTDVDVTVKNSTLNGYSTFTSWADGVNAEFIDSDLTGTAQSKYIYGVIVIESGNAKVTVDENCSLTAVGSEEKDAYNHYIVAKYADAEESEITINTTDITKVLEEHPVIYVQKIYYDIIVDATENGSVTVDIADSEETAKAEGGSKVVVIPAPAEGYEIETVKYNDGEDHEITAVDGEYSFIMPEAAVTVSATFKKVIVIPEGEKYSYTYDIFRRPFFPSYENAEMEIYNFRNPVMSEWDRFSSPEGEWILSEMGTYGERETFSPATGTNLDDIVEWISDEYHMQDDEINGIKIHKLTLGDGTHVCYGVVLGVDEENGYVLFIGDTLGWDGAGYFLSKNEITEESIMFTADAVAPSLPKTGFEVNGERYETLEEAMNAVRDGNVIVLHEDIVTSETIIIDKNITIIGNGHTIYTAASTGIIIDTEGAVIIRNITIEHNAAGEPNSTINIINKPANVTLEDAAINSGDSHCVYIPDSGANVTVTVKDSELNGYSAFTSCADGVKADFINSDMTGKAVDDCTNGVIVIKDGNAKVTVDENCSVTAVANTETGAYDQYVGVKFAAAADSEITIKTTDITKVSESDPVVYVEKAVVYEDGIVKIGGIGEAASLIIASYNGKAFKDSVQQTVKSGDEIIIAETELETVGATQIKVMLWKDMSTFVPLCEEVTVELVPEVNTNVMDADAIAATGKNFDCGMAFEVSEDYDAAIANPYANWIADYEITFDADVKAVLSGNYGNYGWVDLPEYTFAANAPVKIMETAQLGEFTYADIVLLVKKFTCGVTLADGAGNVNVVLGFTLTNPETGAKIVVAEQTFAL